MQSKVALLADIHGNSPALQAVMEDIQRQGCSHVFMLGDLINGVDPTGCAQLLRNRCAQARIDLICLKGNAEAYLLTPDREALLGRPEPWNLEMIQLVQWFAAHLTYEDMEWIRSFHDFVLWQDACLVHDSPNDRLYPESWHNPDLETKYQEWFHHAPGLYPEMPEPEWQKLWAFMEAHHFAQVFCGHTHVPFYREYEGKRVCNPGSVGVPLDGDPRPSWLLVSGSADGLPEILFRRVDYDIARMHTLIDQTPDYPDFAVPGRKEAYKQWLSTGIYWKVHRTPG